MNAVGRAGVLFDYAASRPEGFLASDARADLDWSEKQFATAVRAFRLIFGEDEINLVTQQRGFGQPKLYQLVGDFDSARPFLAERMRTLEAMLRTTLAVANSISNGSDGRTVEGRKARFAVRHLGRLVEDIDEVEGRLPFGANVP